VIRFGGASQEPSTETMPYTKTKAQLAADKATLDKAASEKAPSEKAPSEKLEV
jgi:hypothetical protein